MRCTLHQQQRTLSFSSHIAARLVQTGMHATRAVLKQIAHLWNWTASLLPSSTGVDPTACLITQDPSGMRGMTLKAVFRRVATSSGEPLSSNSRMMDTSMGLHGQLYSQLGACSIERAGRHAGHCTTQRH